MNQERRGRFSKRHGHSPADREITIREDAPEGFRGALIQIASDMGLRPSNLREIVCRVLRTLPDPGNWSEYPNIRDEVQQLVQSCEWYYVYDITEAIYQYLADQHNGSEEAFEGSINEYFREAGIGWQLRNGEIETRGPEVFESSVRGAITALESTRPTASSELHEALRDLSRRPEPDVTGAIQHAMAALECVARDYTGNPRATLGEILRRHPDLLPRPLNEAVEKAWGYASEKGRHLREGRVPGREEAELIVGLSATIATYLHAKQDL